MDGGTDTTKMISGHKTITMALLRSVTVLGLFLSCPFLSFAQLDTSFWFVAPEVCQWNNPYNFDRPIKLVVSSMENTATTITITQPANSSFAPIQQTVPPLGNVSVDLTNFITSIETSPVNTVLNTGLHVVSSQPVNVYYEVGLTGVNPEIFALKGQSALGTNFVMPGQNEYMNGDTYSPTPYNRLDVVATRNGTIVTIVPKVTIQGHAAGVPFNVTLDAGQTYSCAAMGRQPAHHFQGTTITSTHPIAVTVSDDLLHHPSGGQDLVGDQTVPVENAGTEFVAIKGELYQNADKVYITAIQDNTQIFVDGSTTAVTSLNAGSTYVVPFATGSQTLYITTNNPVYAFQLTGLGHEFGGAVLPSMSHTGSQSVSYKRGGDATRMLVFNIITRNGNQGNFTLNGDNTVITSNLFAPVAGTNGNWLYASIELPVSVVDINTTAIVQNTGLFHLGVFEGGFQGGCSYAFFSDYQRYIRADAGMYVACAGETIDINIITADESQVINWYETEQGSTVIHTGSTYTLTKNTDSVQYVYAQLYVNNEPYGDRLRIPVVLTTLCGNLIDEVCEGTILYMQDFGGNNNSDPWFSPTTIPSISSDLTFSGTSTALGIYNLFKNFTVQWAVQPNYDHTFEGDQERGYMMYMNPFNDQVNRILLDMPITGLCEEAKLSFSFWAANMNNGAELPKFEVQLINPQDNTILVRSQTVSIPWSASMVWHQYGFQYLLPPNINGVILRIINIKEDDTQIEWAIDDIQVTYCGGTAIIVTPTSGTTICLGESIQMESEFIVTDDSMIGVPLEYEWQYSVDGNTWQTLANSNSAEYQINAVEENHAGYYRVHVAELGLLETQCSFYSDYVQLMVEDCEVPPCDTSYVADTVCQGDIYNNHGLTLSANETMFEGDEIFEIHLTGENGCDSLVILTLTTQVKPEAFIQIVGDFCEHNTAQLQLISEDNLTDILWNTEETTSSILVNSAGVYSVSAVQEHCQVSRQIIIEPCPSQIYVPNAITTSTPEGNNDYFCVYCNHPESIRGFEMYIYSRWGVLVYYTQDMNFRWQPEKHNLRVENTMFVYMMKYIDENNQLVVKQGTIVVL